MSEKYKLIVSVLPFVDVCVGIGMWALVSVIAAQSRIVRDALGATQAIESIFPIAAIYFLVKISSVGIILVSIAKAYVLYKEKSKTI